MQPEPLLPRRVRVPRGAYGWVELKVITGGWLEGLGPDAALTYLFLCAVGNSRGVSFWSRERMAHLLGISREAIGRAFERLARADLIATRDRVVQVLSLPSAEPVSREPGPSPEPELAVTEEEISVYEDAARTKLAALHGGGQPLLPAVVRALATGMARDQRRQASLATSRKGGE